MIDQAQQRAADAEDPVHDPYTEDVLLLFVEYAFEPGQDHRADHEQKSKMDVQGGKDQGRKEDRQCSSMFSHGYTLEISLHDASREEFLYPCSENIQDLPQTESAEIEKRRIRIETIGIYQTAYRFKPAH